MDLSVKEALQKVIVDVLSEDSRPMTLNFLMHKVFKSFQEIHPSVYVNQKDLLGIIDELVKRFWIGRTRNNKYYLDYLDYEELDTGGEGFLEVDILTGHGYITVNRNHKEYKRPTHFVHKKNINSGKTGDYVSFKELNNTKPRDFSMKDAIIKSILPRPTSSL